MAKAAGLTGRLPSTTSPVWLTRMRSETRTCRKLMPKGFTQKWSVNSGSRAVMCPATPSEKPKRPNRRSAPASFCLRCSRSSSTLADFGRVSVLSIEEAVAIGLALESESESESACSMVPNYRLAHDLPHRRHEGHRRAERESVGLGDRSAQDGGVVARECRRQVGRGRHRTGALFRV